MKTFGLALGACLGAILMLLISKGDHPQNGCRLKWGLISAETTAEVYSRAAGDVGVTPPINKNGPTLNFNQIEEELKQFTASLNNRIMIFFQGCEIILAAVFIIHLISIQKKRLERTAADCIKELAERNQRLLEEVSKQKHLHKKIHAQEAALRQAQKMDSLGRLAGGISHEFNNILGIILGYAELTLEEIPTGSPVRSNLEEIKTASLRGKQVVRQILVFLNKIPADKCAVKMAPYVAQILESLKTPLNRKIKMKIDLRCCQETILANPSDLKQILTNLVTNAAQAIGNTFGTIFITLETIHLNRQMAVQYDGILENDYIRLTVADTGCGMDPKILERVFEPYFTTQNMSEGLGMGLAVVYGLVKNMGGTVHVSSQPSEGTRFEILFPVIPSDVSPPPKSDGLNV